MTPEDHALRLVLQSSPREVPMTAPVHCTDCNAVLEVHCGSRQCHWYRCPEKGCPWWVYDLQRGARYSVTGDKVERLGAPPEVEG